MKKLCLLFVLLFAGAAQAQAWDVQKDTPNWWYPIMGGQIHEVDSNYTVKAPAGISYSGFVYMRAPHSLFTKVWQWGGTGTGTFSDNQEAYGWAPNHFPKTLMNFYWVRIKVYSLPGGVLMLDKSWKIYQQPGT